LCLKAKKYSRKLQNPRTECLLVSQKPTRKTSTNYHLALLFRLKIDLKNFCGDGEVSFYFVSEIYGFAMWPADAEVVLANAPPSRASLSHPVWRLDTFQIW